MRKVVTELMNREEVWFLFRAARMAWHFFLDYYAQYKYLIWFLLLFVFSYMMLLHWIITKRKSISRKLLSIICLLVALAGVYLFTLGYRETGMDYRIQLEPFWSYKEWIYGRNATIGMEVINNILLFFPVGFLLCDVLRKPSLWKIIFLAFLLSLSVESCQLINRLGLFELDDLFNNTLGAVAGWILYHMMGPVKKR